MAQNLFTNDQAVFRNLASKAQDVHTTLVGLRSQVEMAAGDMGQANRSASGGNMVNTLGNWQGDYQQILTLLEELNTAAVNQLNNLTGGADVANQLSGH